MTDHPPLRVLVAGGGVAALEALLALRALAAERVDLELLAPGDEFVHRPSSVLTPFSGTSAPRLPLDRLASLGAPSLASRTALWWPPNKVAGRHLTGFLASEGQTLTERVPEDERDAACRLLTMLADEDAAADDYASAVEALDTAAGLLGGTLPPEVEQRRIAWAAGEPTVVG